MSAALAANVVKAGWLQRLSQSVYLLTGDTPSRESSIAYLGRCIPCLHVGGKTALSWQGVRHNIAFREKVVLWGQKSYRIHPWVAEHLSYSYQTTTLFDDDFPYGKGLKPLPAGDPRVLVSVPDPVSHTISAAILCLTRLPFQSRARESLASAGDSKHHSHTHLHPFFPRRKWV